MPWLPLPQIAFAVAIYPFAAQEPADLPLEIGDELYIIEQGGENGDWFRGYLLAPPSLLAGLTSSKDQALEARVFSGIFPRSCVEVRELLGDLLEYSDLNLWSHEMLNSMVSGDDMIEGMSLDKSNIKADSKQKHITLRKSRKYNSIKVKNLSELPTRDPCASKPPAPVPMLKVGDETPTSSEEPLVDEISSCLREWQSTHLHRLLLSGEYQLLDKMSSLFHSLDMSRQILLNGFLTRFELEKLRENVVWELVQGNKLFNGEVIVRDLSERGRIMARDDSIIELTRSQSNMSLLDEQPQLSQDKSNIHHLLLEVKTFIGTSTESTKLVLFLASKAPGRPYTTLSENYIVEIPPNRSLTDIAKADTMRTLFADLTSADFGDLNTSNDNLYLVVKVQNLRHITSKRNRERTFSKDGQTNGIIPQTSNSIGRVGLKKFKWGGKAQRTTFSRHHSGNSIRSSIASESGYFQSLSRDGPPHSSPHPGNVDEKKGVIQSVYKTNSIGVLKINDILKRQEECEHIINMWTPVPEYHENITENFEEVLNESNNFDSSRKSERLQLQLKAFNFPDAEDLIKASPSLLSGIVITNKMTFSGAPKRPRSDIYLTIDEAVLPRQALLARVPGSSGNYAPLSQNMTGQNLQVTLEVHDTNGGIIENCIFASSNSTPQSSWESLVAIRGESWKQNVRLVIPDLKVPTSHLVMELADVPNDPFAICHLPLWNNQAVISNGHHSLLLYRYDESVKLSMETEDKTGFLSQTWNALKKNGVGKDEVISGPIATLRVQTHLCSTHFLQDKVLLGLLKWKELRIEEVLESLKRLVFTPAIEIVKHLDDVFNALFGILANQTGNDDSEDLIFSALVTVLGIVHDRRFQISHSVDHYAMNQFNHPFVATCLIRSFTRLLSKPLDPDSSRQLRATFKVVKYILRFITEARAQQRKKEAGIGITGTTSSFNRNLRNIFKALDEMMRCDSPALVGSKTLAVQYFHSWLPELTSLLSKEEIFHIAIDFMDSCADVKGKLILYKLVLIINYSKLDLFSELDQRRALCMNTVRWIHPLWDKNEENDSQWQDQVRLCCSIVASQAQDLVNEIPDYIPKIISSYIGLSAVSKPLKSDTQRLSLLFPTTYPFPSKKISTSANFNESLIELAAVLAAISMQPAGMQLELAAGELAKLLEDMLNVHLSILQCEAFPANWLSVHIHYHKSTMRTLEYIGGILLESYIPEPDDADSYNTELWKAFFTVLLKLLGSNTLALETFPEQKRRAIWKIAGDLRETGADLLRTSWYAIGWETNSEERARFDLSRMGGYQVQYVPCLVGPIVELCLSVHEGLRKVAVEILRSIIVSEWTLSEDISVIQTEMIDSLDELFKNKPLTESALQRLFINELEVLFENLSKIPNDPLYESIRELVSTTSQFLDLLVAVYDSDFSGEAAHLINRLRLMEFLRDMRKEEILIRYIHQLVQLQSDAGNLAEAGHSLRLHAELYDWDTTRIVPALVDPEFPVQSHFDRKEKIYFDMIKLLEDGEAWGSAITAYQELQIQYQENTYDYSKLANVHRAIGSIYEILAKSDKLVPRYYRVVYKGLGFPPNLRDKEYIYEGHPNEKLASFQYRMQAAHPSAQITNNTPEDFEGQFLQITTLSPYRDLNHPVLQRVRIPQIVKDYLLCFMPQSFSTTHRRHTSGPVAEHVAEKLIYKTLDRFPTILRRSEIESVTRYTMGPLETGLERLIRKIAEITTIEKRVIRGEHEMAPLLIEALKNSVHPIPESPISQYRSLLPEASLDENNESVEPVLKPLQIALKTALIDFAIMIRRCILMFSESDRQHLLTEEERESLIQGI